MIKYSITGDKADCFGCRACAQVCRSGAISFSDDHEGFSYPAIDGAFCTSCGLCEKSCPIDKPIHAVDFKQKVYAGYSSDLKIRQESSSGGMFSLLSKAILDGGGVVYGAGFDGNWRVRHAAAETPEELQALKVSKYVQSDIGNTYAQAKAHLDAGRLVYFTGTPCQIAGLRTFLRKRYDNLLTSDLVCHGVPSPRIWAKYVATLGKDISELTMRNLRYWGVQLSYRKERASRPKVLESDLSSYLYAFMKNLLHRPVCYTCPYAKPTRVGDITLADYWGIQKYHPELKRSHGVSQILVNTEIGERFFEQVRGSMTVVPSQIEWALESNGNLRMTSHRPEERDDFYRDASVLPYPELERKYMRPRNYRTIRIRFAIRSAWQRSAIRALAKRILRPTPRG